MKDLEILRKLYVQIRLRMLTSPNDVALKNAQKRIKRLISVFRAGRFNDAHSQELRSMVTAFQNARVEPKFEPFQYDGGQKNDNN